MSAIEAVIFDMDGLLVDSEPLWRRAEVEVFRSEGLAITEEDCKTTMGLRLDDVVRARLPHLSGPSPQAIAERLLVEEHILLRVIELVRAEGQAKAGAHSAVELALARGFVVALASSSPLRLIHATLERIGLADRFLVVHSAEAEPYGKPHPAVYLTTSARLGVAPERCVAVEDSIRGLVAAKAASMRCIVVPEEEAPGFALADLVLASLTALDDTAWSTLEHDG